jgi:hypothetical protein
MQSTSLTVYRHHTGFRLWWRALTGSDETLDNTRPMRLDLNRKKTLRINLVAQCRAWIEIYQELLDRARGEKPETRLAS